MQFFIKNKMEEFFKEKMVVIINNMVGFLKMIFQTKISKKMVEFSANQMTGVLLQIILKWRFCFSPR